MSVAPVFIASVQRFVLAMLSVFTNINGKVALHYLKIECTIFREHVATVSFHS